MQLESGDLMSFELQSSRNLLSVLLLLTVDRGRWRMADNYGHGLDRTVTRHVLNTFFI